MIGTYYELQQKLDTKERHKDFSDWDEAGDLKVDGNRENRWIQIITIGEQKKLRESWYCHIGNRINPNFYVWQGIIYIIQILEEIRVKESKYTRIEFVHYTIYIL